MPVAVVCFAAVLMTGWATWCPEGLRAASGKIFAQRLIETELMKHPEVSSLEISVITKEGCRTIAASDPKDLKEKCDEDELQTLRTGKPYVEKEGDGFDVTLAFHDASGKIMAAVGMDFKAEEGQTNEGVAAQGRQVVSEMEAQVPSKDKLFERQD
jgi:hypothetical protein